MAELRPLARAADFAACLALLRVGSKSFHAASRLLPARLRPSVCALYAFCRLADDAVDEGVAKDDVLSRMRLRLDAIYGGGALKGPVEIAFADTVERFQIPRALPEALFEGFAWDAAGRDYQTLSEVRDYAMRVAGTVGMMMALLMGVRRQDALARACDLGVAMQLTNIARDVGEDARAGRLYLPRDWFAEAGLDADVFLAAPVFEPRIAAMTERLLAEAHRLYRRAESGIAQLPLDCRPAIFGARHIYHAIGVEIAANGHDSVSRRAHVTRARKLQLLGRALTSTLIVPRGAAKPSLPEAVFLIEAIGSQSSAHRSEPHRIAWLIDLFERLERTEREGGRDRAAA